MAERDKTAREARVEALLERARAAGAVGAEALLEESRARTLTDERGHTTPVEDGVAHLTVWRPDGAAGTARAPWDAPVAGLVDAAFAAAARAPADPRGAPAPRFDLPTRGLAIHDPRLAHLDDEARREVLHENRAQAEEAVPGVVAREFLYEEVVQHRVFASSRGVIAHELGSRFRLRATVQDRATGRTLAGALTSRCFADVASRPLGVDLARRLSRTVQPAVSVDSGLPVVFGPPLIAAFLPLLARAFRGERLREGAPLLGADSRTLGSERVHLVDDATLPGGYATRAFDDRGVPPMPLVLIREGRLGSAYAGPDDARAHEARPTGHEIAGGGLWIGNLVVRPGTRTRNMVFPELGRFLLVEDAGAEPTLDLRTGELRLGGPAVVMGPGGPEGAVPDWAWAGPVRALLARVTHLCADQERHGIVDTPTWALDPLPAAG